MKYSGAKHLDMLASSLLTQWVSIILCIVRKYNCVGGVHSSYVYEKSRFADNNGLRLADDWSTVLRNLKKIANQ
jgi:hypothetical protein